MKKAKDLEPEARAIFKEDVAANRALGRLGAALIPERARVITHCNTGALATAGYGTALGIIQSIQIEEHFGDRQRDPAVLLQGARLTAWELVEEGVPATLICDSMAGSVMSRGGVHACITGADRIAANGDAANKIGTYSVALWRAPTACRSTWRRRRARSTCRSPPARDSDRGARRRGITGGSGAARRPPGWRRTRRRST